MNNIENHDLREKNYKHWPCISLPANDVRSLRQFLFSSWETVFHSILPPCNVKHFPGFSSQIFDHQSPYNHIDYWLLREFFYFFFFYFFFCQKCKTFFFCLIHFFFHKGNNFLLEAWSQATVFCSFLFVEVLFIVFFLHFSFFKESFHSSKVNDFFTVQWFITTWSKIKIAITT